ncbi:CT398-like coiled coil hairpin domain-containing protein, partial [Streptomyces anthocyanicus]
MRRRPEGRLRWFAVDGLLQDVDQVRQRAARDQQRLDSGAVTSPKDLENL